MRAGAIRNGAAGVNNYVLLRPQKIVQSCGGGLPGGVIGGGMRGIEAVVSRRRLSAVRGGQCDISATFSRYRMGRWSHRGGGITRWELARSSRVPALPAAEAADRC